MKRLELIFPKEADEYPEYYSFLCSYLIPDWVTNDSYMVDSHEILLKILLEKDYYFINPLDKNRAEDGISLRDIFVSNCDGNVPDGPCRILELLVAFAERIEFQIMSDDNFGDRTSLWFWIMLENLNVDFIDNMHYNNDSRSYLDTQIDRWLSNRFPAIGIWKKEDLNDDMWMSANKFLSDFALKNHKFL